MLGRGWQGRGNGERRWVWSLGALKMPFLCVCVYFPLFWGAGGFGGEGDGVGGQRKRWGLLVDRAGLEHGGWNLEVGAGS